MILADHEIRDLGIVAPCDDRTVFRGMSYGLSSAGYDIRVDMTHVDELLLHNSQYRKVMTPEGDGLILAPGQSALLGIIEYFNMPDSVVGFVKDKSTWARRGLFMTQAVLEPGWRGHLTVRAANVGEEDLTIIHGEPVAQVVFQHMYSKPESIYAGKYQDQGRGPQGPRFEQ